MRAEPSIRPGEKYPLGGHPLLYQFEWSRGRTLPEFELILVTDGTGEFESEATGCVPIEGVALFIVFPGVWHRFRPSPAVGWTERWFSFNGELLDRLFNVGRVALASPLRYRATQNDWLRNSTKCSIEFAIGLEGIRQCSPYKRCGLFPTP